MPCGTIEGKNYSLLPNEMFGLGVVCAHFFKIPTKEGKENVGYGGVLG
jgi:hypothetical protein